MWAAAKNGKHPPYMRSFRLYVRTFVMQRVTQPHVQRYVTNAESDVTARMYSVMVRMLRVTSLNVQRDHERYE